MSNNNPADSTLQNLPAASRQSGNSAAASRQSISMQQQRLSQQQQQQQRVHPFVEKFQQVRQLLKWIQEMLMQIRKELEAVGFKCLLQLYLDIKRVNSNQYPVELSQNMNSCMNYFLNLDFKRHIKLLAEQLQPNRPESKEGDEKLKEIIEQYNEVFVSQYAYECIQCFNNQNLQREYYFQDIIQRQIKQRLPGALSSAQSSSTIIKRSNANSNINNIDSKCFVKQTDRDNNEYECDFLNSFAEINLFHKLEVVKKNKVKVNEIHVFQNAYELLDPKSDQDPKPASKLVYSVMEKSLMINDFLERKHLEGEHQHPSILKMRIDDPNESITCVEISRGGNIILCGTQDSQIYLFDVGKFEQTGPLAGDQSAASQMNFFSAMSSSIEDKNQSAPAGASSSASSSTSNSVAIKFRMKFLGHEDAITAISVLYNENYFVSASTDLTIRLWDIRLNICLNVYKGHLKTIWSVKFANQGYLFGSCSADRTAMLWTWTPTKNPIMKVLIGHTQDVTAIDFCENLQYVVTASLDRSVAFWSVRTGDCLLKLELNSPVTSMHFSYSGYYFVTGQENGDVRLWNMYSYNLVKCMNLQSEIARDPIHSVHISFDESTITVTTKKNLAYYNLNSLKNVQGENLFEDCYIGNAKYLQKMQANRFYPVEPKEVFEIPKIQTEKFLKAYMHMRNFIIAISKQTL